MSHEIADFASLSLEPTSFRREIRVPPSYRREGYERAYDDTTLWYDAIWSDGKLTLVCPKLLNLEVPLLKNGIFVDGKAHRASQVKHFRRHDVVTFALNDRPTLIEIGWGGQALSSAVSAAQPNKFKDLNVHITLSKDNELDWLRDHAKFHMHHHGLEAVILIDNGSTRYDLDAISDVYRQLGLKASLVLSAPFKYGPYGLPPYSWRTKFMQTALLNVLRLRYLSKARAVLQCDIDELIMTDGPSIFDMTAGSSLGLLRIPGRWYVPTVDPEKPRHLIDHDHVDLTTKPCPTKYCIRPGGWRSSASWDVHSLEKSLLAKFAKTKKAQFLHCAEITTNWKGEGRMKRPEDIELDPAARQALQAALG